MVHCCATTGDASRHARGQAASKRGPFGDCWFSLAALEHDPAERARVHELIRQAGGRTFDAKRINLVASPSSAYAVCPLGFPPPRLAEAMRQPDFKMGKGFAVRLLYSKEEIETLTSGQKMQ